MKFAHCIALILLLPCVCLAKAGPALPPELLYHGKPIEPICIDRLFDLAGKKHVVDLAKCNRDGLVISDATLTGYHYHEKGETRESAMGVGGLPYIDYEYIGKIDGKPAIKIMQSGGGTGHFSNVAVLKREGSTLSIVELAGAGDRCNGGIVRAEIKNGALLVDRNVTPGDFLDISGVNPHRLKPYEALEASAASCIGQVRYRNNEPVGFLPENAEKYAWETDSEWVNQYTHQTCFNQLMNGVPPQKMWTMAQVKEFMRHFNRTCVEQKQTNQTDHTNAAKL